MTLLRRTCAASFGTVSGNNAPRWLMQPNFLARSDTCGFFTDSNAIFIRSNFRSD
jgi:hypothetical protein